MVRAFETEGVLHLTASLVLEQVDRVAGVVPEQVIGPGDRLKLSCFFDNPTDTAVNWGDGTTDEMCLATMYMID